MSKWLGRGNQGSFAANGVTTAMSRVPLYGQIRGSGVTVRMASVGVKRTMWSAHIEAQAVVENGGTTLWSDAEFESTLLRAADLVPISTGRNIVPCPPPGSAAEFTLSFPPLGKIPQTITIIVVRNLALAEQWLVVDPVPAGDPRRGPNGGFADVPAGSDDTAGKVAGGDGEGAPTVPAGTDDRPTKACPDCGETVLEAARVCRFCRYEWHTG